MIGVPDDEWGEAVAAVIVLHEGAEGDPEALRAWVAERLRSTRAPQHIEFRAELPYSETGKLLRRVLKAELTPESPGSTGPADHLGLPSRVVVGHLVDQTPAQRRGGVDRPGHRAPAGPSGAARPAG